MGDNLILVVEDEPAIRQMTVYGLRRAGYRVAEAADSRSARAAIADERPDIALIDWMLPDYSGLELTRSLKSSAETRTLPIILVTARASEADKVAGLEGGADDYITKPFSPRELHARILAVLRRAGAAVTADVISVGVLRLDRAAQRVCAGDAVLTLGPTEYRLLEFLMLHPERVFRREQLLDRVWGGNVYLEERTVDVHVRRLRLQLQSVAAAGYLQTVRGTGYRLSKMLAGRAVINS
jgi:two-component system, OmpR family, phosphate regulon response regulator PhoB